MIRKGTASLPFPKLSASLGQGSPIRATAGLIVAEATTPNAGGQAYANITAIHTDAHVADFAAAARIRFSTRWPTPG
ncbi:hypothetical protein GCM10009612_06430 [Streptomyces beijiangensis]